MRQSDPCHDKSIAYMYSFRRNMMSDAGTQLPNWPLPDHYIRQTLLPGNTRDTSGAQ